MICRLVLYHALPGTDPMAWLKAHAADIRGVPGMRYVDFVQSLDDARACSYHVVSYQSRVRDV